MIRGSVCRILFHNQKNSAYFQSRGKNFIRKQQKNDIKFQSGFTKFCSLLVNNAGRNNQPKKSFCLSQGVRLLCLQNFLLQILKDGLARIPFSFKEHSVQVMRTCTRQCECVLAHRIRRGQQMFSLYTKLWDEMALKELVSKMRGQFTRRGKEFLLSLVGVTAYNWEKMRISDQEIVSYMNEIDNVYRLRDTTVTCEHCHLRLAFDVKVPNVQYCVCRGSKTHYTTDPKDWTPFIERKDLIVWRKEDTEYTGLYAYKVYGSYNDVTASDFLRVQLDTEYRKEWDHTAVELTVLDSDPKTNSDIIYWVMKWPRMFSNRDYVFNRRFKVDEKEKVMVVVNKCTEHPKCPERCENIRVKEYWSSMVIRPHKHFSEPGIEFCLTYFDDPGVSIPSAITSWVAVSGLPDFMMRVRQAARELAVRRKIQGIPLQEFIKDREPCVEPVPEPSPESDESPEPPEDLPTDVHSKTGYTTTAQSTQSSCQDTPDTYLQLSTARLFL